jgi:hypothetical protein
VHVEIHSREYRNACQIHNACGNYSLHVEITLVRVVITLVSVEITLVRVVITFIRVKFTMRVKITLCV